MKTTKAYRNFNAADNGDDTATRTFRIRMAKNERKLALKRQYDTIRRLQQVGIIEPQGCHCSHCQRDFDCCGRMFPAYVTFEPAKRGIKVTQHYLRNI